MKPNPIQRNTTRYPLQGLSLQKRLPLLIGILLSIVVITFSLIAWIGVKRAALQTGKERLSVLTGQLSSMLSGSAQGLMLPTQQVANQPVIKKFLRDKDPASGVASRLLLEKLRTDSLSVTVELLDEYLHPVASIQRDSLKHFVDIERNPGIVSIAYDSSYVSKFFRSGDSLYYAIVAPVKDQQERLGYVVRWRLVMATPQAVQQFSQLLGAGAKLYVGNTDRGIWTDLREEIKEVPALDSAMLTSTGSFTNNATGESMLAAARPVPATPWLVLVEFSTNTVLASVNTFMQWIFIAGALLIILGLIVASTMSRNITRPLRQLTSAASSIAAGDYSPVVATNRRDEIGKLARAFNAMTVQVKDAHDVLEKKIEDEVQLTEQLRSLSAHLVNVREQERIHIAREMHDELGQLLTSFKMDVSWVKLKLQNTADPIIVNKLEEMKGIVDEAVKFVRKLSAELRPSILDDWGIIPALDWHSKEFTRRFEIDVTFTSDIQELNLSPDLATGLFRMYQESLTNVARHAAATKVDARLSIKKDKVQLVIIDNGKGFVVDPGGKRKTLGLIGMQERALMIGGQLDIQSIPGKGTTVVIEIPLREKADETATPQVS